jgi:hypothetical protein
MPGTMPRRPKQQTEQPEQTTPEEGKPAKKRNVIFVTLDEGTEWRLQQLIDRHRIKPDRAAVAFTAIIELLDREGIPQAPAKPPKKADE